MIIAQQAGAHQGQEREEREDLHRGDVGLLRLRLQFEVDRDRVGVEDAGYYEARGEGG